MWGKRAGALVVVGLTLLAAPSWAQAPLLEVKGASEFPVWKTVTVGQHRGVDAIRNALDKARIAIGESADEVLGRPAFSFSRERHGWSWSRWLSSDLAPMAQRSPIFTR